MKQIISRFMPYVVKVKLRRKYDLLIYNVGVYTGRRDPFLPPYWLYSIGDGDFSQIGEEFFKYFVHLAGLQPHESVLDVGCGTGRMARPLTRYLKAGSYEGIDIVAPSIRWCQKTYTRRYPDFHFHFADVYNKEYNPAGSCLASEYRFPFKTASFDFVFLTSVFTHMLRPDVEQYLSEVARVLKPGGRCLITYFLLNPDSLNLIEGKASSIDFNDTVEGCRVQNRDIPEAAIAHDEKWTRELYQRHGLNISEPIRYGSWCGRKNGLSYQDIVIASKPL